MTSASINKQFKDACRKGDLDLVNLMIEKGADAWNEGLHSACRGGYLNTAEFMIEKGADEWNWGLFGACQGGNLNLVNLMIEKGADEWNWGLLHACYGGHLSIAKLMIEKGATNWNSGLDGACQGGYLNTVKLMIEKGADNWKGYEIGRKAKRELSAKSIQRVWRGYRTRKRYARILSVVRDCVTQIEIPAPEFGPGARLITGKRGGTFGRKHLREMAEMMDNWDYEPPEGWAPEDLPHIIYP